MNKIDMQINEARRIIKSAEYLDIMNKKYGYPHGENPIGIVIEAILTIASNKRKGEQK